MDSRPIRCGFDSCPACQIIEGVMNSKTDRLTLMWYAVKISSLSFDQVYRDLRGVDISKTYRDLRLAKDCNRLAVLAPYLAHSSSIVRDVAQCRYAEISKKWYVCKNLVRQVVKLVRKGDK